MSTLADDPYLLARTLVPATDSVLDIGFRARQGYSPIERLRARLRVRSRFKKAMGFSAAEN
jgi:hypothetical protein